MVKVDIPAGVLLAVVTCSDDVPEPVTVVGLKVAEAPVGSPATLRLTTPLKPAILPTVAVYVVLAPGFTDALAGVAVKEKSGVTPWSKPNTKSSFENEHI
jgi:hypothetical protein